MPKAHADIDLYEAEIEERNATLRSTVEESKWLVDLCALLALTIGSNALFFALVSRAYHDGVTLRLAFGIVVILVVSLSLWTPG